MRFNFYLYSLFHSQGKLFINVILVCELKNTLQLSWSLNSTPRHGEYDDLLAYWKNSSGFLCISSYFYSSFCQKIFTSDSLYHHIFPPSYDGRPSSQDSPSGSHWLDSTVLSDRAGLILTENFARLSISPVHESDKGLYKCRVDFRKQATKTTRVKLEVIGQYLLNSFISTFSSILLK